MSQQQWCEAIIPQFDTVAFDPLDPEKRYHDGVFVKEVGNGTQGSLFHVTGDVIAARGMRFEVKVDYDALESGHLYKYTKLGWVLEADYKSGRIRALLEALPTPTKQQGINFWERNPETGNHDIIWTKENGDRYGPGEQRRPTFKCNEWTRDHAVPALRAAGILRSSI